MPTKNGVNGYLNEDIIDINIQLAELRLKKAMAISAFGTPTALAHAEEMLNATERALQRARRDLGVYMYLSGKLP